MFDKYLRRKKKGRKSRENKKKMEGKLFNSEGWWGKRKEMINCEALYLCMKLSWLNLTFYLFILSFHSWLNLTFSLFILSFHSWISSNFFSPHNNIKQLFSFQIFLSFTVCLDRRKLKKIGENWEYKALHNYSFQQWKDLEEQSYFFFPLFFSFLSPSFPPCKFIQT